ncbi:tRNA pseudouridine(38-40) synthase TruA [Corynebacterium tapiri]|uniref:tRNA pseudouridine synthase A n=1 Tax=Corynebacterium tapiri TaxID=1448266 RepID=A0A5C4U4M3_9CORY|nr:tRNA pseudouridine(38-40) synthase TruA [Corynebacterium tapiri]TNL98526.1 tRNA pseudouridine(38-40) synthase TruA [Corynebacterium tapiri]
MSATRLRLDLAYDGTDFHGWAAQKDPELRTVQGELEKALTLILRTPIELTVAGRTDAGVHATGQVAHVDVPEESLQQRSIDGDPARLVRRLGRFLRDDLVIRDVTFAPKDFDARFSALDRTYSYRVTTHPSGANPLRTRDTAVWNRPVDLDVMNAAASMLIGLQDFAAFCKARPHATTVRELLEFSWEDISTPDQPQLYRAHVVADAFCWSMVRSLVGACLKIGQGNADTGLILELLNEQSRSSRIPVAPAKGLSLTQVRYPSVDKLGERALTTRARRDQPQPAGETTAM